MSDLSSRGIFLSYRRADAAPYARLLQSLFSERIPDARVFMDLDAIEPGLEFAEVIREAVNSCAVLVALIGRRWATLADEEGRRRLDDPDDYVCFEIQTALQRGVRVIPVLVDGASPPRQQQLPAGLHKLARLNALELSYGRYQYDADRLLDAIQRLLAPSSSTGQEFPPTANAEAPAVPHEVRPDGNTLTETAQKDPKAAQNNRARTTRVLNDAARTAQFIPLDYEKAAMLADIARALAATDPDRAARLGADAERTAQSITYENDRAPVLVDVARALAATDPSRAARLGADAEQTIRSIRSNREKFRKSHWFGEVARALAATDPDRAERIAQSITDDYWKAKALVTIAEPRAI